jgi:hypothetical protein
MSCLALHGRRVHQAPHIAAKALAQQVHACTAEHHEPKVEGWNVTTAKDVGLIFCRVHMIQTRHAKPKVLYVRQFLQKNERCGKCTESEGGEGRWKVGERVERCGGEKVGGERGAQAPSTTPDS